MLYIPYFFKIFPFLPLIFIELAIGMGYIRTTWLRIVLRIFYILILIFEFIRWQISNFIS